MKKLLLSAPLAASSLAAQGVVYVIPAGPWPLCENAGVRPWLGVLCATFTPGNEAYMLLIRASNTQTVAYRYTVTGTLPDGTPKTLTGTVARTDQPDTYATVSILSFGGVASNIQATVEELAVIAVTTSP